MLQHSKIPFKVPIRPLGTLVKLPRPHLNLQLHRTATRTRRRSGQKRACLVLCLSFFCFIDLRAQAVVYSQPADTGTGTDVNTQLLYAINHLKANNGPMRLEDLAIRTQTPLDTDKVLFEKFKSHERVEFDPKTNLYSFKHDYSFRSKAALLTEIQRSTRRGGGISVRTLKESWKDSPTAVEELEKEGEVFVTRTLRDGQMRMVFWNELKADPAELAEEGPDAVAKRDASKNGTGLSVEKEFYDLWHNLSVPNDVDLLKQLQSGGLQETASEAPVIKGPVGKRKGKKSATRQRTARLTNTHLKDTGIDLSKDYVAPGK